MNDKTVIFNIDFVCYKRQAPAAQSKTHAAC